MEMGAAEGRGWGGVDYSSGWRDEAVRICVRALSRCDDDVIHDFNSDLEDISAETCAQTRPDSLPNPHIFGVELGV